MKEVVVVANNLMLTGNYRNGRMHAVPPLLYVVILCPVFVVGGSDVPFFVWPPFSSFLW